MFSQQAVSSFTNLNRIGSDQNHNYEKNGKRGFSNPHTFDQNQQLQQIFSLLIPLIQLLLSHFQNNNHCCQPNDLNLSDGELEKLNQALYPDGLTSAAGLPSATGVVDNDCDGKVSIGDQVRTTSTNPATQETTNGTVLVDQEIIDRFNAAPSLPLKEIQFDEAFPKPITHLGRIPIKNIEFFGDGYQGILEDGNGFGAQIAAGSTDPRPRIEGKIVIRTDYTNDTATYLLEDGATLTGLKPFNPL